MSKRRLQPELMDEPGLEPSRHLDALRGLDRINLLSLTARTLWSAIRPTAASAGGPLRVLDVATGGGDNAVQLWSLARSAGFELNVEGCDISERALAFARDRAARRNAPVRFFQLDAVKDRLPTDYDVIVSSLFIHHLEEPDAFALLSNMRDAARRQGVISDLIRCRTGLVLAHAACRALSRSDVVHYDGPRSVESAFTMDELRDLAVRAGMNDVTVTMRWPFRLLLDWKRPPGDAA